MGFGDFNFDLPAGESYAPDPERVAELVRLMPAHPYHLGAPWCEREVWDRARDHAVGQRILAEARAMAGVDPRPQMTDDAYLACLETRDPVPFNLLNAASRGRLGLMILAECLEPTGEFLPIIEDDILRAARMKSWIHPGNDTGRDTFEGRTIFNDLTSVHLGSNLVGALHLLGDRLSPEVREVIRVQVKRRLLDPFRQRIESGKDIYWWVRVTHNWNSVCLLYTTACALALLDDPRDRAWYVAVAEDLIRYSEDGFEESGFYTEGVGYWNYGFGCYVVLAELVRAVTGGAIDWMEKPKVERMSHFGRRLEIQDKVYPGFADCRNDVVTPPWLDNWMLNRSDPRRTAASSGTEVDPFGTTPVTSLLPVLMVLFRQVDFRKTLAFERSTGLREWFEDVQFLICRPRPDAPVKFASTFKGGHNGVNHNHNDLGAFTVLIGNREVLTDPGAEVYTDRTFSSRRYESDLLNSFGHPVPVPAGQLQAPGKDEHTANFGSQFKAVVVETAFSDDADRVVLDLRQAYQVATLVKLTRSFTHFRSGEGKVVVVDEVAFSRAETFETALITYGDWQVGEDGTIRISLEGAAVEVKVSSHDGELVMSHCRIEESSTPTRLSWAFREPVESARVVMEIREC